MVPNLNSSFSNIHYTNVATCFCLLNGTKIDYVGILNFVFFPCPSSTIMTNWEGSIKRQCFQLCQYLANLGKVKISHLNLKRLNYHYLTSKQSVCLVLPAIRIWNSNPKRVFQKWTISKHLVIKFWRFLNDFGDKSNFHVFSGSPSWD